MIDLSVILVNFNTEKLTRDCIESLIKNTKKTSYEIIVVDNASKDGSVEMLKRLKNHYPKKITLKLNNKNVGYGSGNNQGMKISQGRYLLLLNTDTLISDNAAGEMVKWMDRNKKIGIATCALKNRDGSMQGTGGYFPTLIRVFSWMTIQDIPFVDNFIKPFHPMHTKSFIKGESFYDREKELDWVTGAFFLIRDSVLKKVGYFDEDYFMYTEETDYCFRTKENGWKVYYNPRWSIIHYGGASGKSYSHVLREFDGVKTFYRKHYPPWQYPLLRLLLKVGALGRIVLFGIVEGKEAAQAYAEAFKKA